MDRFSEELKLIPRGAWITAVGVCIVLPLLFCGYLVLTHPKQAYGFAPPLLILAFMFALFFVYILLVGYIAGDAKRRGMRPVLWVLLSFLIPNMIGIILYFILRNPLLRACPQCGTKSAATFAFCPSCGAALSNACPSCRTAVETGWSHCAKCGSALRTA
jgi:Double zinc ribbon